MNPIGQEFTLYIDELPWHCLVTDVELVSYHYEPDGHQDMRLTIRMWPDAAAPRRPKRIEESSWS